MWWNFLNDVLQPLILPKLKLGVSGALSFARTVLTVSHIALSLDCLQLEETVETVYDPHGASPTPS